jgi:F0F1-type ATP synthase assembly protein I
MWRTAALTGAVGIEVAVAVAIGYFGGDWLDGKFHSTPWLKWIGFGAGIGAAIKALVRVTRDYKKSLKQDEQ